MSATQQALTKITMGPVHIVTQRSSSNHERYTAGPHKNDNGTIWLAKEQHQGFQRGPPP